jgi:hypothetical protein
VFKILKKEIFWSFSPKFEIFSPKSEKPILSANFAQNQHRIKQEDK